MLFVALIFVAGGFIGYFNFSNEVQLTWNKYAFVQVIKPYD